MKKLFVTGLSGFVGQAIRQSLINQAPAWPYELVGTVRRIELLDPHGLAEIFQEDRPDYVIHLAAQSFVPEAIKNPRSTYEVNFLGTLNLLEALKASNFRGRLLYIGTGDVYGLVEEDALPISETQPLRPRNPYAVSKAAAEMLCFQWNQSDGMDIVSARPFNHIGAGQSERFVVSDFAKQIAEIKKGLREPVLHVGDVDVTRDFTDVRDVVRAYLMLLRQGSAGEAYNVCSGNEHSIRGLLVQLMELAGVNAEIVQDPQRLRRAEQRRVIGSYTKLHQTTGWRPQIEIKQSLQDALSYWEKKIE